MRLLIILFLLFTSTPAIAEPLPQLENVEEPELSDTESLDNPKSSQKLKEDELEKELANEEEINKKMLEEKQKRPALEKGYDIAVLKVLNKVTARASKIEVSVGNHTRIGTLDINLRSCWKSPEGEKEENTALLEIYEIKPAEPTKKIFLGWIFSSNPSISSIEHPFYDVTIVSCKKNGTSQPK